jgi:putative FmdB family regulatory protein
MPVYEYVCDKCKTKMEIKQSISDPPITECQKCSGPLRKQFSTSAIIFKGSGWYVTDNPTRDRKQGIEKDNHGGSEKKTESPSKETKTEKVGAQA